MLRNTSHNNQNAVLAWIALCAALWGSASYAPFNSRVRPTHATAPTLTGRAKRERKGARFQRGPRRLGEACRARAVWHLSLRQPLVCVLRAQASLLFAPRQRSRLSRQFKGSAR